MSVESELTFTAAEPIEIRAVVLTMANVPGITLTQGNRTLVIPLTMDEALSIASGLHVVYATVLQRQEDVPRATTKEVGHA